MPDQNHQDPPAAAPLPAPLPEEEPPPYPAMSEPLTPPPPYPGGDPRHGYATDAAGPPAYPGEGAPVHPVGEAPAYPGEVAPPAYPGAGGPPAYREEAAPPPYPGSGAAPAYPGETAAPMYPDEVTPPAYPGAEGPASYPEERTPPPSPGAGTAPAYPGETAAPMYPDEVTPPAYPGAEGPPSYPEEEAPPPYPDSGTGEGAPPPYPDGAEPPPYPGAEGPPVRPGEVPAHAQDGPAPAYPGGTPAWAEPAYPGAAPGTGAAPPPPYQDPSSPPGPDHDDLALQSGRKHLKAHQRGVDGASLAQLVMSLPVALISLSVVSFAFSLVDATLGLVMAAAWLLSGPLVFHRPAEAAIARYLLGMRRPTPAEAERLGAVWAEVTRRAGVSQGTYELWVQERAELNATAAAGHIVAVTRHALDRLPNSRLAAVLAHELGHHVGGHTWAGMLADWYALPARTIWRWIRAGLAGLLRSKSKANVACGGCLGLLLLQFVYILAFQESMWWLIVPLIAAPVLIAWLHRRAEFRADDYAAGLGFRDDLMAVLAAEHEARAVPGAAAPSPPPFLPPGAPPMPPPLPQQAGALPERPAARSAHSNFEARLQHLGRDAVAAPRSADRY